MAQYFAEVFDITSVLQTGGGEGVAQRVGMDLPHCGPAQINADAFAVAPGFGGFFRIAGEKPGAGTKMPPQFAQHNHRAMGNRNFPA